MAEKKPVDIQHEEEMAKDDLNTQLREIRDMQSKIVDSMQTITTFITDLPKQYIDKENTKPGPLWNLIKAAKKIGSF